MAKTYSPKEKKNWPKYINIPSNLKTMNGKG